MHGHEHFEELCALAASGQISADEWHRLLEHLDMCSSCAETLGDFGKIGTDLMTEFSGSIPDGLHAQMRSRFLDRARETGTQLRYFPPAAATPRTWKRSSVALTGLLAASVLLGIAGMYFQLYPRLQAPASGGPAAEVANSRYQGSQSVVEASGGPKVDELLTKIHGLEAERSGLQVKLSGAIANQAQLESRVKDLAAETEIKNRELTVVRSTGAVAAERLTETQSAIEKADSRLAAQEVQITLARADKEKLAQELAYQKASSEQARALLATGKDGQSILASRNLHIVDVYDADTRGKRRSFGRIFYVENQELLFYAYDLSDPRHANAEFYAWGAGLSPGEEVARLGLLHNDGKSEKRWVLKYNDASVLAKLDSIFVTAETGSNPDKPKGKRVLFAVLAGQPNHP
jgi:hypothetical protein